MRNITYNSPISITYIRHGESEYNANKKLMNSSDSYILFKKQFEKEWNILKKYIKDGKGGYALIDIIEGKFPTTKLKELAKKVIIENPNIISPFDTKLTEYGSKQCIKLGKNLKKNNCILPDVIYVSPYLRTKSTLANIIKGWPELGKVKVSIDTRLREQEYGTQILFADKRIQGVFNPYEMLCREMESEYTFRHSNGESLLDVIERHNLFFKHLYRKDCGKNVMIIGHHLGLLALITMIENWDREKFLYENDNNSPANASVTNFVIDKDRIDEGKLKLDKYNSIFY